MERKDKVERESWVWVMAMAETQSPVLLYRLSCSASCTKWFFAPDPRLNWFCFRSDSVAVLERCILQNKIAEISSLPPGVVYLDFDVHALRRWLICRKRRGKRLIRVPSALSQAHFSPQSPRPLAAHTVEGLIVTLDSTHTTLGTIAVCNYFRCK